MELEIEVPGTNLTINLERIRQILDQISNCYTEIQQFCKEDKLKREYLEYMKRRQLEATEESVTTPKKYLS